MTCIVILEVTAKKGTGMQLVENLRALLPDTRNKDGCQGVEVTTNLDDADKTSSWWSAGQRANTTRTTSPGGNSVATSTS